MENSTASYDIAIIGGGITGAAIAREAALRNLKVILFEKNTFGSGTSSKSSKLIHGGIRYLELSWEALKKGSIRSFWKNLKFVFSSLKEARTLELIAPGIVKPISLFLPLYVSSPRKPRSIFAGVYFYYILSALTGRATPPKIFSKKEDALKIMPELNPQGLLGGILFWDRWADDLKLVRATVSSAQKKGAITLEKTFVNRYAFEAEKKLYRVDYTHDNNQSSIYSRKVISAAGPWIDELKRTSESITKEYIAPIAGSHITIKKFLPFSCLLQADDKRLFFVINIDDKARVGTTERLCRTPDHVETTQEEVLYLLRQLRSYFPGISFEEKDILSRDSAIRPLAAVSDGSNPNTISREHEVFISPSGVIHVVGVKLTDHRRAAEKVLKVLQPYFEKLYPSYPAKSLTDKILLEN